MKYHSEWVDLPLLCAEEGSAKEGCLKLEVWGKLGCWQSKEESAGAVLFAGLVLGAALAKKSAQDLNYIIQSGGRYFVQERSSCWGAA